MSPENRKVEGVRVVWREGDKGNGVIMIDRKVPFGTYIDELCGFFKADKAEVESVVAEIEDYVGNFRVSPSMEEKMRDNPNTKVENLFARRINELGISKGHSQRLIPRLVYDYVRRTKDPEERKHVFSKELVDTRNGYFVILRMRCGKAAERVTVVDTEDL